MTTFRDALGDLEHRLEVVERALEAGEDPQLPEFVPTDLIGPVTDEDVARFEQLMARLAAVQAAIQLERVDVLDELSGLGKRRTAVNAYARHT